MGAGTPIRRAGNPPAAAGEEQQEGADAAGEISDSDVADLCFQLIVRSLGGECLATIADAKGPWRLADVVAFLPPLLPGHEYELVNGEARLGSRVPIGRWVQPVDGSASVTAVGRLKPGGQVELDSALVDAVRSLEPQMVDTLLGVGADASCVRDPKARTRTTPLHALVEARAEAVGDPAKMEAWSAVLASLLAARADVNAVRDNSDWRGCGASGTAFGMLVPYAVRDADLLARLLAARADANAKLVSQAHTMRTDGSTTQYPLHAAVERGCVEAARMLLGARADVNAVLVAKYDNERGHHRDTQQTALHMAAGRGHAAMVELLLECRADVNVVRRDLHHERIVRDRDPATDDPRDPRWVPSVRCVPVQETALHVAILGGRTAVADLLVQAGADTGIQRLYGGTGTPTSLLRGPPPPPAADGDGPQLSPAEEMRRAVAQVASASH